MIDTVIFDVGGTLVDFPDLFEYFGGLYSEEKRETVQRCLRERVMSHYTQVGSGSERFSTIQQMMETALSNTAELLGVEDISSSCGEHILRIALELTVPYADTIPVLDTLKGKGIRLLVASDADTPLLHMELERLGLRPYFTECIASGDIEAYKPSDAFLDAIRPHIHAPGETLFVGDNRVDIVTGQKLGVQTVYKSPDKGNPHNADYVIAALSQLIEEEQLFG